MVGEKLVTRREILKKGVPALGLTGLAIFAGPQFADAWNKLGAQANAAKAPDAAASALPSADVLPANFQELFARIDQIAEGVGGIWAHPDPKSIVLPRVAPFLPATEDEVNAFGKAHNDYGLSVYNRIIMLPSDHPEDHITAQGWTKALSDFGEARKWGDITAWENTWVYPMMLTAGEADIAANKQVQVMSNGKMVDIDPIRADNWAVSANVINRGNPKMAVYMVPWVAGEIHARLPQDTEASEVTMGFALNQHFADLKTQGNNAEVVPAIIVRGVATAPVSILYSRPIDDNGGYETRVVETRLEPLTGNVTIHLPRQDFRGDFAPFIAIRMPVVATNPKGETEVIFVPGSDVLPPNPTWAPKHRITEADLRAGKLVQ